MFPCSDKDLSALASDFGEKLARVVRSTGALEDGDPEDVAEEAWHEWVLEEIQQELFLTADQVGELLARAERLELSKVFRDAFVAALNEPAEC